MKYFETHAHYDDDKFLEDLDGVLAKVRKANVERIVNVACDFKTCISSYKLSKKYEYIYYTIGVHPYSTDEFDISKLEEIYLSLDNKEKLVAVGEIGLDYSYDNIDVERQRDMFIKQIEFAKKHKLPIVVHTRDASKDTYDILRKYTTSADKVLIHCFNPTDDLMRLVLERERYMVAFGGNITYKRKASFENYVNMLPLSKLLIETDSPYLAPVPKRGERNDSSNLSIICEKLASLKGVSLEEMANITYENATRFYNIK